MPIAGIAQCRQNYRDLPPVEQEVVEMSCLTTSMGLTLFGVAGLIYGIARIQLQHQINCCEEHCQRPVWTCYDVSSSPGYEDPGDINPPEFCPSLAADDSCPDQYGFNHGAASFFGLAMQITGGICLGLCATTLILNHRTVRRIFRTIPAPLDDPEAAAVRRRAGAHARARVAEQQRAQAGRFGVDADHEMAVIVPVPEGHSEKSLEGWVEDRLDQEFGNDVLADPITLAPFKDPVVDPAGHTFSRASIMRHLQTHNTCPVGREPLRANQLAPNRAVKQMMAVKVAQIRAEGPPEEPPIEAPKKNDKEKADES
jgi:hypothetical protein